MFQFSSAKQVRRDQLQSPESSSRSSPDPTFTELLRERVQGEFSFTTDGNVLPEVEEGPPEGGEEEAELILFAGPSNVAASQSHKIRLSSPDAATGEPGILAKKPKSYYFADGLPSERENEYQAAAIDGQTIVDMSREPWPGCALPWKVRTISAAGMKKAVLVGHPPTVVTVEDGAPKRKRKGKKCRIALRKKLQAAKEREAEQARLAQEKEETEREKRTRKNREKKVKKKAREQAKKLADAGMKAADALHSDVTD